MKKIILLALFLPFLTMAQENRIGKVSKTISAAKVISGDFQSFEIINPQTKNATENYSETVNDGVIFKIDQAKINELLDQDPKQINLSIPYKSNGETVALDLIQVAVFSPDFKAITDTGQDITNEVDFGKHYRGVIAGNDNSLVSISIFESQIIGFIASEDGNFSIGKIKNSDIDHIIYNDSDLKITNEFICSMEDDGVAYTEQQLSSPNPMDPGDEVDIYIEAGQSVYNQFSGNLTNTVAFLTSVFAQSYVLYANDGILARTSNMLIWVNTDPYNGADSFEQRDKFHAQTDFLNGDLGHLVEMQPYGGLASGFDGICPTNSDNSLCYSGLQGTNVPNVPTYSWNVMVVTHEMGHLMGSRHTHACVWNGDNTAIDSCAPTEGGCPPPGNPSGGGTIMSYCHLQGVGINFNQGFGPQPTAVILNNIEASGNCLDDEGSLNPPVAVCKTHIVILDTNGEATIDVDDIDGGSYDDDEIVSMSIDIETLTCDNVGVASVTLTVIDNDGLIGTCISYVEVIDESEATVSSCPEDFSVIIPEGTTYELLDYQDQIIVTTDICTVNLAATSQSPSPGNELPVGVHEITVSALLDDGSVVSCSFEITVEEELLGLEDNSVLSSLILYPNPTVETVYLSNPNKLELESISIYDMIGRLIILVDLKDMGTEQSIDVSKLSESNYFVIIQGKQNKIIKQLIIN